MIYDLPEVIFPNRVQEVKQIKSLAAKCGRTIYNKDKHEKARSKLREKLEQLDTKALFHWARFAMIDHRWSGATGQGAYWAVASRCVNEESISILKERK